MRKLRHKSTGAILTWNNKSGYLLDGWFLPEWYVNEYVLISDKINDWEELCTYDITLIKSKEDGVIIDYTGRKYNQTESYIQQIAVYLNGEYDKPPIFFSVGDYVTNRLDIKGKITNIFFYQDTPHFTLDTTPVSLNAYTTLHYVNTEVSSNGYDSKADTLEHIRKVSINLNNFAKDLLERANNHDESKLHSPEKELFDVYTPRLANLTYGSDEYKANLAELQPALDHHYANNSHHPQFHKKGVDDMTLMDVVEMFCDWKAAVERTLEGNFDKSLFINQERFNIAPQLVQIFKNTNDELRIK